MKILPGIATLAVPAGAVRMHGSRGAVAASPTRQPATGNRFAIHNAQVFDGTRLLPRVNVLVLDGRISAVGMDAPIPEVKFDVAIDQVELR